MLTSENIKNRLWLAGSGLSIVIASTVSLLFYMNGHSKKNLPKSPSSSITITPTATPTPLQEVQYSIEILNGSGIKGDAAKAKILLETAHIPVSSIGNADGASYQITIIRAPKTIPESYLQKLSTTLSTTYVLSEKFTEESTGSAITIILGKQRK